MLNVKSPKLLIALGASGLVLAAIAAALLFGQFGPTRESTPKSPSKLKEAAPAFTLALLGGESISFDGRAGRPILVNFFASWCLPCRDEMPAIEKISREYRAKGVEFLGIAVDDTEAKVREFAARYGVTFPLGLDQGAAVQKAFGVYGVPTTYFIDRKGVVNYLHAGAVTEELLRHELDKLL